MAHFSQLTNDNTVATTPFRTAHGAGYRWLMTKDPTKASQASQRPAAAAAEEKTTAVMHNIALKAGGTKVGHER